MARARRVFEELGLGVVERGWLSSNTVVFRSAPGSASAVVDTGYVAHATLGVAAIALALDGQPPERLLNTHLHSDHCGGNQALQARWAVETWVPEASVDAVSNWDPSRLSYEWTGQQCPRFVVSGGLAAGQAVRLGSSTWEVIHAPGHDPDAVMLWQPQSRVLISADALWESRVSIIFPELVGEPGFGAARLTLQAIATLNPAIVIPGHGSPFSDVGAALAASHARLTAFEADPGRHLAYGVRALTMFHMLEHRGLSRDELEHWLVSTPVFVQMHALSGLAGRSLQSWAESAIARLVDDGVLAMNGDRIEVAA